MVKRYGKEEIAYVYLARQEGNLIEFVESTQPPIPRDAKWVLIVSVLYGCPVGCKFCDASHNYNGKITAEGILEQIDYMVRRRFPDGRVPIPKFKIQFARMGEPALNDAVLTALEQLPSIYDAPGIIPCVSTIAPAGREQFFSKLRRIKEQFYHSGRFQLQFSIHTTDPQKRRELIPVRKWSLAQIAEYAKRFVSDGDRKVTLNFAIAKELPVVPAVIAEQFDPETALIKITPVNPTISAMKNSLDSYIDPFAADAEYEIVEQFKSAGFEVILSIGETEENQIGSNCGQFVSTYLINRQAGWTAQKSSYSYVTDKSAR